MQGRKTVSSPVTCASTRLRDASVRNPLTGRINFPLEIAPPFYRPGAFAGPACAGAGSFVPSLKCSTPFEPPAERIHCVHADRAPDDLQGLHLTVHDHFHEHASPNVL